MVVKACYESVTIRLLASTSATITRLIEVGMVQKRRAMKKPGETSVFRAFVPTIFHELPVEEILHFIKEALLVLIWLGLEIG